MGHADHDPAGQHAAVRELSPRGSPARTLAQAIVAAAAGAGGTGVPSGALAVTGSATGARVVRVLEPPRRLPSVARWCYRPSDRGATASAAEADAAASAPLIRAARP